MKTVLYARVSTGDIQQAGSCDTQLARCRQYCSALGYEVVAEIKDEGVTGTKMDRPGWRRVEHLLSSGQAQLVLATTLDRLTRTEEFHPFVKACQQGGYGFATLGEKIDTSSAVGRLLLSNLIAIGAFFAAQTGEKVKAARKVKAEQGYTNTTPPFGTLRGPVPGVPVKDPERWPHIERAFELAAAGVPRAEILQSLRSAGVTTLRGAKVGHSTLAQLLENRFFLGEIVHDGKSYPARHDCRIDPKIWHAAQGERVSRPGRNPEGYTYLLENIAVTSHYRLTWPKARAGEDCPLACQAIHNGKGGRFACYVRGDAIRRFGGLEVEAADAEGATLPKYMNAQRTDRAVVEWLIEQSRSGVLRERLEAELLGSGRALGEQLARRGKLARKLKSVRAEQTKFKARFDELVAHGTLRAIDAADERLSRYEADVTELEAQLEVLDAAIARLQTAQLEGSAQLDVAADIEFAWREGHMEHLQHLLRGLLRRVDIRVDGLYAEMYTLPPASAEVWELRGSSTAAGFEPAAFASGGRRSIH